MRRGTIPKGKGYRKLVFTETFVETFAGKDFTFADRRAFIKALRLLDEDEPHPSLRVHQLKGDRKGAWSASASQSLRMTFDRLPEGAKLLLTCSKHHDR